MNMKFVKIGICLFLLAFVMSPADAQRASKKKKDPNAQTGPTGNEQQQVNNNAASCRLQSNCRICLSLMIL